MTQPSSARLKGLLAERDELDQRITQLESRLSKKAVAIGRVLDVMRKYDISAEELLSALKDGVPAVEPAPAAAVKSSAKSKAPRKSVKKAADPTALNPLPGK